MSTLVIGYQEALTQQVITTVVGRSANSKLLTLDEVLDPTLLSTSLGASSSVILITTDTFLGIAQDLNKTLNVVTEVLNEALRYDVPVIHIGSALALGRGSKGQIISADTDWADDLDWDQQAFLHHRIDREFWRATAEGLQGNAVALSIVDTAVQDHNIALQKAKELLGLKCYPVGSAGVLSEDSLKHLLQHITNPFAPSTDRQLWVDRNISYKEWLKEIAASTGQSEVALKPIVPIKKGLRGWWDAMLGRNYGLDKAYLQVLSTELNYTSLST